MAKLAKALSAAAGSAGGDKVYVEDVFSTYLFTGTQSTLAINNGIDLADKGGLVWIKARNNARSNALFDTERGANLLASNTTAAQYAASTAVTATNSNGFTLGSDTSVNKSAETIASWTFAKQKGFFDCVKFSTTSGGGQQTVSHNLGSIPGTIILKQITSGADGYWYVFNKSVTSPNSDWWRNYANLNITAAFGDWGSTAGIYSAPTSSAITVSTYFTNQTADFIAYFFAEGGSDDQIFGDDGDEAIIKCGSYTGNGNNTGPSVTLGFEPQWVLIKRSSASGTDWIIADNMRGMPVTASASVLFSNLTNSEATNVGQIHPTATGFNIRQTTGSDLNTNSETYIYMAIRRGPMKEPSAGTDVFQPIGTSGDNPNTTTATFPWDTQFNTFTANANYAAYNNQINDRLRGVGFLPSFITTPHLTTANTNAQTVSSSFLAFKNNGMDVDKSTGWGASATTIFYNFRRYPKVFDVVVGNSDASGNVWNGSHNLNANIEFAIVKNTQSASTQWWTAHIALGKFYKLNQDAAGGNLGTDFTSTTTTFKAFYGYLENNETFVMYAFATLAGISKVGSVVHSGTTNVDCGFSGGARFVLIKRTDSTGDWYVWDTVRGIVAGNDPYFLLNTLAAQVTSTDYIDPLASGFTLTSSFTAGTYIFLAFA